MEWLCRLGEFWGTVIATVGFIVGMAIVLALVVVGTACFSALIDWLRDKYSLFYSIPEWLKNIFRIIGYIVIILLFLVFFLSIGNGIFNKFCGG